MTTPTGVLHPPGALYEQAAQFGADLATMQQAAADQMLAAHAQAYAQIRTEYDALLAKVAAAQDAGKPQSPAWLYQRARLKEALATTKVEIARYADAASDTAKQAQWAAVQASVKHAAKMSQQAIQQTGIATSFVTLNPANLEHLVGFLHDGTPLDLLFASMAAETSEQIRSALLRGMALGKGVDWMSRQVDQALDVPRWRAETIMRTESQRVYRSVARQTYQANSGVLTGWTWVATLDARVCPCCLIMDGTEHPVTATLDGHPRCRCAMVPRTKTYDEILGLPAGTTPDSRPPVRSGKQWLEGQSAGMQRALLGAGKWKAWKNGKITLDDVVGRTHDQQWGTMRRERSLREIDLGLHANWDDQPPPPPAPVEYQPNRKAALALSKAESVESLEDLIELAEGQEKANAKAALAMALNAQDYTVTLPQPDEQKAAKATGKMNAAVLSKGYPSKGYSQTVAIYKAQANGEVGSKVGVVASLTWRQKITAGKALADHQEWLEGHLAAQQQAKTQGQDIVALLQTGMDDAHSGGEAVQAIIHAEHAVAALPAGPEQARAAAYVEAMKDAYGQAAGNVIDLIQQADTWWNEDGASLALGNDGWGFITYPSGSTQDTNPQQTFTLLTSGEWTHTPEPDPAKVAGIVSSMTTNEGYLDTAFVTWAKGFQEKNPGSAQQQADFAEALKQAEATLLPVPDGGNVQKMAEAMQQDEGLYLPIYTKMAAGDQPGATKQNQSDAAAALKQHEAWKAQQAQASTSTVGTFNPKVHQWLKDYDDGKVDVWEAAQDGSHEGTEAASLIKQYEDSLVDLGPSAADWYESTHAKGGPETAFGIPKDPSWPEPKASSVQAKLDLLNQYGDEYVGYMKDDVTGTGVTPAGKASAWEALKQYEAQQGAPAQGNWTPAHEAVHDYLKKYDAGHLSKFDAVVLKNTTLKAPGKAAPWYKDAAESGVDVPTAAPVAPPAAQAAPSGPFGAPPSPDTLTFTGKTLGTHGAQVWEDAQGNRYLFKPPKASADAFLVSLDEAASVLQARTGLKAPDTWTITLNGQYGSLQRMFDATPAFQGGFKPQTLTPDDLLAVQQQHVLDWLLSNHDGHVEQFLRLPDGSLVGIDKGQAFRWMGMDRLAWDFHPNGYYGAPPPVYNALWGDFAKGGSGEVLDPRTGPLADFIDSVQGMSDDDLRALFRPYAEQAAARGLLAAQGQPQPGLVAGTVQPNTPEAFLNALIARKNSLADDFADLYERAAKERQKALPDWKPTKPTPTPAQKRKAALKALKGAPEPKAPTPPAQPATVTKPMFDGWLAKAEARYQANPNKAKPNLQATANWTRFERVIDLLDRSAVQELLDRQYLTQEMADEALDLIAKAEVAKVKAEADFAKKQAAYERAQKKYATLLKDWREANGIVFTTRGMDEGVLRHGTDREGVQWADSQFSASRWTAGQRQALQTYTGGTYSTWNGQLRRTQGDPGQYAPTLDKVDAAMPIQPMPEDVILHRGTGTAAFDFGDGQRRDGRTHDLQSLVGSVQVEHAYMSSSVGNSAAFDSYEVQMKIRAPKGTHGAYVKAFSNFSAEREVILARGIRYYVHAVYKVDHRWAMEVEIVDADFQPPLTASGAPEVRPSATPWTRLSKDGTA